MIQQINRRSAEAGTVVIAEGFWLWHLYSKQVCWGVARKWENWALRYSEPLQIVSKEVLFEKEQKQNTPRKPVRHLRSKWEWERNASLEPVQFGGLSCWGMNTFNWGSSLPYTFVHLIFHFSCSFSVPSPPVGLNANYLMVVIPSAEKAGSWAIPVF